MASVINSVYRQIFKVWRKKRFQWFIDVIKPEPSDVLLDVGGYPGFWTNQRQPVARIDSLNVHSVAWEPAQAPDHRIEILTGDGCNLPMADKCYDIGFSNSVIEHVGSWEDQKKFANEIRRVANKLWIQTPAYECPLEPHFLTPFVHYLSPNSRKRIARWFTVWGWLTRPSKERIDTMVETTRLLRKCEMMELFPDCEILTEPLLLGIPKSYVAVRRESACP